MNVNSIPRRKFFNDRWFTYGPNAPPGHDLHCPAMTLPRLAPGLWTSPVTSLSIQCPHLQNRPNGTCLRGLLWGSGVEAGLAQVRPGTPSPATPKKKREAVPHACLLLSSSRSLSPHGEGLHPHWAKMFTSDESPNLVPCNLGPR